MVEKVVIECAVPVAHCKGLPGKRDQLFQKELRRQIEALGGKLPEYEILGCEDMGENVVEVWPNKHRWDYVQRFTIRQISLVGVTG